MAKVRLRPDCCCSGGRFECGYITFLERHSLALQPNPEYSGRTLPAQDGQRGGPPGSPSRRLFQEAKAFLSPAPIGLHHQRHKPAGDPWSVCWVAGVLVVLRLLGREAVFPRRAGDVGI